MPEGTKPNRRRTSSGPPVDDGTPVTGVPGTEDGPPDNWRGDHPHAHDDDTHLGHTHPEGQSETDKEEMHSSVEFDQGAEANRSMEPEGPPTPEEVVGNGEEHEEEITRPVAGRSSTGENPQAAFGDVVIDVKTDTGGKLLKLFESRAKTQAAHRTFGTADRDIKTIMAELGHYNGDPINVRVGGHLFSLVATSNDKEIEAFTRHGSQRKAITHPA